MKRLGSEKDIHFESGLFKPKLWSRQIFKKGMAYFLCFVLLVGSMQGISCAEGNLEEIAERIESEEPQSVSHDSENEQSVSSEEGISSGNEEEAGNQAENGENIAEDRPEEIGAEDGSEENSEAGESGLSEEEAQKKKAVYMDAGSFSEQADHDLTVTAIFGDKTFFEGTKMKVEVLEEESIIEEAKAALEAQYRKVDAKKEAKAESKAESTEEANEDKIELKEEKGESEVAKESEEAKKEPEIEVLEVVDISFYREIDGVEKEVQPKNGKKVEIRLEKTEKIKEVLEEDGKEELIGEDAEDSNTQEESSETREAQSKAEEAEGKNEGKKVEEKVTDSELAKKFEEHLEKNEEIEKEADKIKKAEKEEKKTKAESENKTEKEAKAEKEVKVEKDDKKEKEEIEAEEELRIVHLSEGRPTEILPVKEEDESFVFSTKHFSTFLLARRRRDLGIVTHELRAYWKDPADPHAGTSAARTGHSYTDGSNGDIRKQVKLSIVPPENYSNALNTTTLAVEMTLRGDKNTKYNPGAVKLYIPARIFKGWDDTAWNQNKITVSSNRENWVYKVEDPIKHGIPLAPDTNDQSSFNYTLEEKDGEPFLCLQNYNVLSGGITFKADFAYNLTPSMLKVHHDNALNKGVYDYEFPIQLKIENSGPLNGESEKRMSVHVETKVNPTKVTLKPGTADVNGGVFFKWDPTWGPEPAGANNFFYAVWYVRVDRARGSSQPFKYQLNIDELDPTKTDGGILVGAKKMPMDSRADYFLYNLDGQDNIEVYARDGYRNITKNMNYPPTAPLPAGNERYLVNPLRRDQVGISQDPSVYRLPDNEPYLTDHCYSPNARYNSQLYALLFKYPYSKLKAALDDPTQNVARDGLQIKNEIQFTEIWADGHRRENIPVTQSEVMRIFPAPKDGGLFSYKKYAVEERQNYLDIFGLQSIYKEGTAAPLRHGTRTKSFSLSAMYNASAGNIVFSGSNYSTSHGSADPNGSGVTITDGKYYLFTSKIRYPSPLNGKPVYADDIRPEKDLEGLTHDEGTNDFYRGTPYVLTEDDYHYSSIYLDWMKVYDVEPVTNHLVPGVKFNQKPNIRTRNQNYPPVEVWLRRKGNPNYFKYGAFSYDSIGRVVFTPEPLYTAVYTANPLAAPSATNQISLEDVFPGDKKAIVGLQLRQNSPYYRNEFECSYTMDITPTPDMQNAISATMERTDDYNVNFLAGAAVAEGRQYNNPTNVETRIGHYWPQIGYVLTPLNIVSTLNKLNKNYVDHPETGTQTIDVCVQGTNYGSLPASLQGDEYTKVYQVNQGIIYDLLPAGTEVIDSSIDIGTWIDGWDVTDSLRYQRGHDYTVQISKNWEGSGQDMMIIRFSAPNDPVHRLWHKRFNRSGWKLTYTLSNPYFNIVDRGRNVMNTVGYVNTDPNTVWFGNYISDERGKFPVLEKIRYYKNIRHDAAELNPRFTTSVFQRPMVYGPVTVLEAGFTNTVSTEINSNYLTDNISYMGDPYKYRILYQAASTTRTTDMVLFDLLGDKNGEFDGVDIETMLTKRTYDPANSATLDTLKPRVFVSYSVPTEAQKDLGKALYDPGWATDGNPNNPKNTGTSIWKEWNYENESANTGIDKKQIQAIAFDLRTTAAGKKFTLDQQGLLIANLKMKATTDQAKVSIVNVNTAQMKCIQFKGTQPPSTAIVETLQSFAKHRLVKPYIFDLPVKKVLEIQPGTYPGSIANKFTYTMEDVAGAPLENKDGHPLPSIKNPDADGGTASFTNIRLLRPGTYKFKISEEGLHDNGFTPLDMGEKFVTITVKDPDHRQLTSNLTYNAAHPLIFRNAYRATSYKTEFKVQKFLTAAPGLRTPDISNSFSFTLKRKDASCPMPVAAGTEDSLTLKNPDADGGEVDFGEIEFTARGVYEYTITESGEYPGVENDQNPIRNIKVSVREFGTGKFFALVSGDELEFTNTFKPYSTEGRIELDKIISGTPPASAANFEFNLKAEAPGTGQPMPDGSFSDSEIVMLVGEGHTAFEPIHFTEPGTFNYTLEEVNDGLPGYTYDPSVYTISFDVRQSEDSIYDLIVEKKIYKDGEEVTEIVFDNKYTPSSSGGIGGGGGGHGPKPIVVVPPTPGGPGEPEIIPPVPDGGTPEAEKPEEKWNSNPKVPRTAREIEKRIDELLAISRKRALSGEELAELRRLKKLLSTLRKAGLGKVKTADSSKMLYYAFALAMSSLCIALYYLMTKRRNKK